MRFHYTSFLLPRNCYYEDNTMRFILVALVVFAVGSVISYGTVVRFAGEPVSLKSAGAVISETLADVLQGSSGSGAPAGAKLFAEVSRVRPAPERAGQNEETKTAVAAVPRAAALRTGNVPNLPAVIPSSAPVARAPASASLPVASAPSRSDVSVSNPPPPPRPVEPPQTCDFSKARDATHLVLLNELAWMGSPVHGGEDGGGGAQAEWIELKNNAGRDVDLTGWRIVNASGKLAVDFPKGEVLEEGAFYLLERGSDETVPDAPADMVYSGVLSNNGEWLRLFDRNCVLVDEVDASRGWHAGENASKKTMERSAVDLSWHTSGVVGGTPKRENSAFSMRNTPPLKTGILTLPPPAATPPAGEASSTATSTAAGGEPSTTSPAAPSVNHVVIAAVQITGGAGLSGNDFIKLFNPTASAVDVSGWKLRKRAQTGSESSVRVFAAGQTIPAGGYFVWANSSDGFALSLGANESSTQTIAANNSIALLMPDGVVVDALAWGEGHTNPFREGSPYAANPEGGQKLTRKTAGGAVQDTDNNAADFSIE
jgi:alkylated DNA nucleotide flippase Atl1